MPALLDRGREGRPRLDGHPVLPRVPACPQALDSPTMSDVATMIEEEADREIRWAGTRVVVWLAVAAGIAMAAYQAVQALKKKRNT